VFTENLLQSDFSGVSLGAYISSKKNDNPMKLIYIVCCNAQPKENPAKLLAATG
jgi:hypothetical protein